MTLSPSSPPMTWKILSTNRAPSMPHGSMSSTTMLWMLKIKRNLFRDRKFIFLLRPLMPILGLNAYRMSATCLPHLPPPRHVIRDTTLRTLVHELLMEYNVTFSPFLEHCVAKPVPGPTEEVPPSNLHVTANKKTKKNETHVVGPTSSRPTKKMRAKGRAPMLHFV
ncbi:hypothetical protein V6N11_022435 [Hibiscus sabdariffa]|uniref:Uncharacterized protein n=1 Tax=Hibiscus sabdariffa TaxID=183260 RepID=A0ABR2TJ76_9ROSI